MKTSMRAPRAAHSKASSTPTATTIPTFLVKTSSSLCRCGSRGMIDIRSAQVLTNRRFDLHFRNRADNAAALDAVLEHHQQGNALDVKRCRGSRILVDIELAEADVPPLSRELLDDRRDHSAWAAPRRPEVDDGRARGDCFPEVGIGQRDRMCVVLEQRCLALPANGGLAAADGRNSIGLSASGTPDDVAHCRSPIANWTPS